MKREEFENILKTVSTGTEFKAHIKEHKKDVTGKLCISREKFWLCYDDGPGGDRSPDRLGYEKSWVVVNTNIDGILNFELLNVEPAESKVIDNYEIF